MTLKELSEHPELASEEDLKALTACFQVVKEMGKRFEPLLNGVTMDSGRSKEEIAYSYYVETMLMAAILESFTTKSEQEFKEINKFVFNYSSFGRPFFVFLFLFPLFLHSLLQFFPCYSHMLHYFFPGIDWLLQVCFSHFLIVLPTIVVEGIILWL